MESCCSTGTQAAAPEAAATPQPRRWRERAARGLLAGLLLAAAGLWLGMVL